MKGILKLILIITIFMGSCAEDDCQSGSIDIKELDEFGCLNAQLTMMVDSPNEFDLIRSQDEYNQLVSGTCEPQINWQEYDLIAGRISFDKTVDSVSKRLTKDCFNNQLTLRIEFNLSDMEIPTAINFHALIPKLSNEETIFVEFIINE